MDTWNDLVGKEIVAIGKSSYSEYLKKFKDKNNLNFKVKEVDSYHNYSEYDYVVCHTGDLIYQGLNALELGDIDPIGIGIAKNKVMLKNIIDKVLKYRSMKYGGFERLVQKLRLQQMFSKLQEERPKEADNMPETVRIREDQGIIDGVGISHHRLRNRNHFNPKIHVSQSSV